MTFLDFVLTKYLGEPDKRNSNGEAYWPCPVCGHSRFHLLPHKPPYRDRFKCWSCDFWGDAHDFLKLVHPNENYVARLARLGEIRKQFVAQEGLGPFSLRGVRGHDTDTRKDAVREAIASWCEILGRQTVSRKDVLELLTALVKTCKDHGVTMEEVEEVVGDWLYFELWSADTLRRHLEVCEECRKREEEKKEKGLSNGQIEGIDSSGMV